VPLHSHAEGTGQPIVVLPSLGLDQSAMRAAFEPAFSNATGWSRIYLDLPGTGGSPPDEPTSDAVPADVIATLDAAVGTDEPFLVAGWSYGGYLAAALARRMPERVAGLLMVCSGFKIRPGDRDLSGVLGSSPEPGWLASVPSGLHEYLSAAVGCQTAAAASRVAAVLAASGPVDESYFDVLRADGFALSEEDQATACERPASFLCGRRDRIAGYRGVFESLGRFPDADYVLAAEAGHFLPVEQPYLFEGAVRSWLGRCA
jgi:pimeloyl-ACP methyl ester carboxylesterase